METPKEFRILVRRNIPYITQGLWRIVVVLFLIVFLFYLYMSPTKNTSNEMATVYYILVMPEWLKRISAYAFLGLIIFLPLYFVARVKKSALLIVSDETLFIKGKQLDLIIPFKSIKKIYFNDLKNLLRQSKEKLQVVIQQKSNKSTVFLLANYEEAEIVLDTLSEITNAEFAFYDDNMQTIQHDE